MAKGKARKARLAVAESEYQGAARVRSEETRLRSKTDEALFVLDTAASIFRKKRRLEPKPKVKTAQSKSFKVALKARRFEVRLAFCMPHQIKACH